MKAMQECLGNALAKLSEVEWDVRTPDPKPFKGEPDGLDRFLLQLENKFILEPSRLDTNPVSQSSGIDEFIDELSRLVRITGYGWIVVKDKLRDSLDYELAMEWARQMQKPAEIGEQLALLRDMGHRLEDCCRSQGLVLGS